MNTWALLTRSDLMFSLLEGGRLQVESRAPLSASERNAISKNKRAIIAALRAPQSSRWRLTFLGGAVRTVQCGDPVTRATMLRDFPEAVDAHIAPAPARTGRPLRDAEQQAVLTWLSQIGETRPEQISATLAELETDDRLRTYVLTQSPAPSPPAGATCGACDRFSVDTLNPAGGLGRCPVEGFLRGPGRTACTQFRGG